MSRLTWQSLSQDTVSLLIDAYTLESISEGDAFVTCEDCRRTYLVRTIAQVAQPNRARCLGCGAASMRRAVRAFSSETAIEPDPDIVPGSIVSLQAAVRRGVESGAVVRVPPGTYRGTLILEGAVSVVGTVAGAVMIVGENAPALIVRLPAGVAARAPAVRGLTPYVHRLALSVDGPMLRAGRAATRAVLAVEVGSPTFQSCTIDATAVDGIAVIGASSAATITDTTVRGAGGYGINVERRATVTLEGVEVHDAHVAGVRVMGGVIAADGLVVRGGPTVGIVLSDKATGTLSRCDVAEIGRVGITIAGAGTAPELRDTTVRDGAGTGILVSEDASPTLERCTVSGHAGAGIDVCTGADPIVRDCTVRDGLASGIRTRSGGRGVIERCTVTGHPSGLDLEVTAATRVVATAGTGMAPRRLGSPPGSVRASRAAARAAARTTLEADLGAAPLGTEAGLTPAMVAIPSPTTGTGAGLTPAMVDAPRDPAPDPRIRAPFRLEYLALVEGVAPLLRNGIPPAGDVIAEPEETPGRDLLPVMANTTALSSGMFPGDHVPVYLNARNARMHRHMVRASTGTTAEQASRAVCIVRLSPTLSRRPGTLVADGDPASPLTQLIEADQARQVLDMRVVRGTAWTEATTETTLRIDIERERQMQAVIFVPGAIPATAIREVIVPDEATRTRVESLLRDGGVVASVPVTVSSARFFTPGVRWQSSVAVEDSDLPTGLPEAPTVPAPRFTSRIRWGG
jgi:hypothetical protein